MNLIYATYRQIGRLTFLVWIFPGMEDEFSTHFKKLFWKFYLERK